MQGKHISSQYDTELTSISSQVLEVGSLVITQIQKAIFALLKLDLNAANEVSVKESQVNAMELDIDRQLSKCSFNWQQVFQALGFT